MLNLINPLRHLQLSGSTNSGVFIFIFLFISTSNFMTTQGQPFSGYLSLDGVNDYAETDSTLIQSSSDFTIECWFRMCAFSSSAYLFDSRGSTAGNGVQVRLTSSTNINVQMQGAGGFAVATHADFTIPDVVGNWHHFAIIHRFVDSSNIVFLDGQNVGAFIQDIVPFPRFVVSKADYTTAGYFDGEMDQFRVSDNVRYSAVFTPSTSAFVPDLNTVALWHFDDGQGSTSFSDASGNGNGLIGHVGAHSNNPISLTVSTATVCPGASVQLGVSGGLFYTWSPSNNLSNPGISNPVASPQNPATYIVSVSDSGSCVSTDTVQINHHPQMISFLQSTAPTCVGRCDGAATVRADSGTPPYIFDWQDPQSQNTPTASALCPGNYDVYISDASGCYRDTISVTIMELPAPPSLNLGSDTTLCDSTIITLDASGPFVAHIWDDFSGSPTRVIDSAGTYFVQAFDSNGCSISDTITIDYMPCDNTFVHYSAVTGMLKVFPNPANNFIHIKEISRFKKVEIIDSNGRKVKHLDSNALQDYLDISNLQIGVYFLKAGNEKSVVVAKLFVL